MPNGFFGPRDDQEEDLKKVGAGYKKMMESGIALMHPVTIEGKDTSSDGVPFHTTVKVFHHENDRFSQAHDLASQLDLTPPDPAQTTVNPMVFKDRHGDDVHVLELGGDAERIVASNGSFAHMGFPVKYKYRPHVTIDESTYNKILESKPKTAAEAGIEFGEAELRHGKEILKRYPSRRK